MRRYSFTQRRTRRHRRHGLQMLERLEDRAMLDGAAVAWNQVQPLSLSFAPEGTLVGNQSSSLYSTLNQLGDPLEWQTRIVQGLETWSQYVDGNVAVVADQGLPLGSPGPTQRDPRFGDVRVAAIPLDPGVLSVSVPANQWLVGSWAGDILINAQGEFRDLDHLFAVMVHEAAHIYGLKDTQDPLSPRYDSDQLHYNPPTASDIAEIQQQFGVRIPDAWEGTLGNDTLASATHMDHLRYQGGLEGTAPTLLFGDITTPGDRDIFRLPLLGDDRGTVTVQLSTQGISTLSPRLRILQADGSLLQEGGSLQPLGGKVELSWTPTTDAEAVYLEVSSSHSTDPLQLGGYVISAEFAARMVADPVLVDQLRRGDYGLLTQDQVQELFGEREYLRFDDHTDDELSQHSDLASSAGFEEGTHYQIDGSISDMLDVDTYRIAAPTSTTPQALTIDVRTLQPGTLIPSVQVFDEDLQPLAIEVLANGLGQVTVQWDAVQSEAEYVIQVRNGDPYGIFATGNYRLIAQFGPQDVDYSLVASGVVAPAQAQSLHTLYVAQSQLLHLALEAGPAQGERGFPFLVANLRDAEGSIIQTITAQPGSTGTHGSVLLLPGTYQLEIVPRNVSDVSRSQPWGYQVWATSVSDPLAVDPTDPSQNPFACPGVSGVYCYPANVVSDNPSWWEQFLGSGPTVPNLPLAKLVDLLVGDWWAWHWQTHESTNGPALARDDEYLVTPDQALVVGGDQTLLANDRDPEGAPLSVLLVAGPYHGDLTLYLDGTFEYVPAEGFHGIDSFSYSAYDFSEPSSVALVTLDVVPLLADLNGDTTVDASDAAIMFGHWDGIGSGWRGGDLNLDGNVDAADAGILFAAWTGDSLPAASSWGSLPAIRAIDAIFSDAPEMKKVTRRSWRSNVKWR